MKIALFSDIHANLPALEAVLSDIDSRSVDAVYCLGDLVGYNCWPNEVTAEIRKRQIPTIAGNYDFGIGRNSDDCGCAYKTDEERAMGKISIAYTNELVTPETRDYLRSLPAHIRLEFQFEGLPFHLLLVHGSPRKINEYLFEDREEKSLLRIMDQANAHILCFGHTHNPFHRIIGTGTTAQSIFRHAINIGSVGKPKDGNPRAGYVILILSSDVSLSKPESVSVEFVRVEYDIEKAAKAIECSSLPNEYAEMLRNGG